MPLRDYDIGMVEAFAVLPQTDAQNRTLHTTQVAGIPNRLPVLFGMVEQWFLGFTLPAINVTRVAMMPDASRRLPAFRGVERSTNPATPNTYNVQARSSEPFNLLYDIELAASSQADMNALVEHVIRQLPPTGYGSFLTVFGTYIPYRQTAFMDRTDYTKAKDGRVFRYTFTYMVEAWLTPLDCLKVGIVDSINIDVIAVEPGPDWPAPSLQLFGRARAGGWGRAVLSQT